MSSARRANAWRELNLSHNRLMPAAFELLQLLSVCPEMRLHLDHQASCAGVPSRPHGFACTRLLRSAQKHM
jgi:hypothetical protein